MDQPGEKSRQQAREKNPAVQEKNPGAVEKRTGAPGRMDTLGVDLGRGGRDPRPPRLPPRRIRRRGVDHTGKNLPQTWKNCLLLIKKYHGQNAFFINLRIQFLL